MSIFKHILTRYKCLRCELCYSCTAETQCQVLHGVCWSCSYVEGLSYAQQDWMLLGYEEEMEMEDYWS